MNVAAVILLALVAIACVADTEAAFCRVSSYKVPLATAVKNKSTMYDACLKAKKITEKPVITKQEVKPDGCVLVTQRVTSSAVWDAYSSCEKSDANKAQYTTLKSQAKACDKYAAKLTCQ